MTVRALERLHGHDSYPVDCFAESVKNMRDESEKK